MTDENRLLTPDEIDDIFSKWTEKTQGDIAKELGNTFVQAVANAQRDLTSSLKDAEYQARVERIFKEIEIYLEKTSNKPQDFRWLIAFKKREGISE